MTGLTASANRTSTLPMASITVHPSEVDTSSFIKSLSVTLKDKTSILNFYDNLYVHAIYFNIFLSPSTNIIKDKGVVPAQMPNDSSGVISTSLNTKKIQTIQLKKYSKMLLIFGVWRHICSNFYNYFYSKYNPLLAIKNSHSQYPKVLFFQKSIEARKRNWPLCHKTRPSKNNVRW